MEAGTGISNEPHEANVVVVEGEPKPSQKRSLSNTRAAIASRKRRAVNKAKLQVLENKTETIQNKLLNEIAGCLVDLTKEVATLKEDVKYIRNACANNTCENCNRLQSEGTDVKPPVLLFDLDSTAFNIEEATELFDNDDSLLPSNTNVS